MKASRALVAIQKSQSEGDIAVGGLKSLSALGNQELVKGLATNNDFIEKITNAVKSRPQLRFGPTQSLEPNTNYSFPTDGFVTVYISGDATARGYSMIVDEQLAGVMFDQAASLPAEARSVQAPGTFAVQKDKKFKVESIDRNIGHGRPVEPGSLVVRYTPLVSD